jgi:uncharacterized membrane protein YfbV (UPF0208 family)
MHNLVKHNITLGASASQRLKGVVEIASPPAKLPLQGVYIAGKRAQTQTRLARPLAFSSCIGALTIGALCLIEVVGRVSDLRSIKLVAPLSLLVIADLDMR